MMMIAPVLLALAGLANARPSPIEARARSDALQARQSLTRDELVNGGSCPSVIFIFARGSTEVGNLGTLGPDVASGLEDELGGENVWIQGVGGDYDAALADNFLPDGTSRAAIREMTGLFELADSSCPDAQIVAGGYSQGAALAAATIRDLDASIREKVVGTVLFGYTKNEQNDGQIPNYPSDRLLVFCNFGDLVCEGQLIIAAPHLAYGDDASGPAPEFLLSKIN